MASISHHSPFSNPVCQSCHIGPADYSGVSVCMSRCLSVRYTTKHTCVQSWKKWLHSLIINGGRHKYVRWCLQAGPLTDGDTLHERHHDHQLPEQYGVVGSRWHYRFTIISAADHHNIVSQRLPPTPYKHVNTDHHSQSTWEWNSRWLIDNPWYPDLDARNVQPNAL